MPLIRHIILPSALILLSSASYAARPEIAYTYMSIGGNNGDRQMEVTMPGSSPYNEDLKFTGFKLNGSFAIADNFYLYGAYSNAKSEKFYPLRGSSSVQEFDVDYYNMQLGFGAHSEIMRNHHGVFQLNYEQESYSIDNSTIKNINLINTDTESGISIKAGVRSLFADFIETGFYIEHVDTAKANTGAIAELRLNAMQKASLGFTASFSDNTLYGMDFRINF